MALELPGSRYVEVGSSSSTIVEGVGPVSVCLIGGVDTVPLTLTTECEVDEPNYCYEYDACGTSSIYIKYPHTGLWTQDYGLFFNCFCLLDDIDFICINETFTISPGEKRCFNITVVDDSVVERTEYFHVLLEGAGGEEYYYWDLPIKDNEGRDMNRHSIASISL